MELNCQMNNQANKNKVHFPTFKSTTAYKETTVREITFDNKYTAIEISSNNDYGNVAYEWCTIDKETYITANGKKYLMTYANGIKVAPQKHISHTLDKQLHSHCTFHRYHHPLQPLT